jgi:hypothetical protein
MFEDKDANGRAGIGPFLVVDVTGRDWSGMGSSYDVNDAPAQPSTQLAQPSMLGTLPKHQSCSMD